MKQISRRTILGTAAAMAVTPAFAEGCQVGPPQHHKGPLVFMDYDQLELDASYDQVYYEPLIAQVSQRLSSNSDATRARVGAPQRAAYGPSEIEKLDIYRTNRPNLEIIGSSNVLDDAVAQRSCEPHQKAEHMAAPTSLRA